VKRGELGRETPFPLMWLPEGRIDFR
jgi:hypothetical protein